MLACVPDSDGPELGVDAALALLDELSPTKLFAEGPSALRDKLSSVKTLIAGMAEGAGLPPERRALPFYGKFFGACCNFLQVRVEGKAIFGKPDL